MKINLIDLKKQHKPIRTQINRAIKKVIDTTSFILGEDVALFEKEYAQYCGTQYAVGVDNGTSALELSLIALGIGKGDKVIVPAFTFIATATSVYYTGAQPVFVDVEEDTCNLDINKTEELIKKDSSIKAIIPVHLYGQACRMDEILALAKKYNLKIVEDACQASGALYKSSDGTLKKAGSMGDTGCFSFYPAKNLGACGDGGIVTTNNKDLYTKIRFLRDCGRTEKYLHEMIGFTKRLDTIQAAILRIKLKKLDKWNEKRRNKVKLYCRLLKNSGVTALAVSDFATPIYHQFVIKSENRDSLRDFLTKQEIGTGVHYPIPLHLQPAFKFLGYKEGDFPVSEKLSKIVLSLPIYAELKQREIEFIAQQIHAFNKK
ncbi:MAG: DegT/DnrJ/EryC1/StrS family aminotransferase [Elusimicrobia bacterium]|nr:DegT/DnrJ/EryC1/StrS family aminotransferase [Elusimicrobiota bacterium]